MASLTNRLDRLTRAADETADEDASARWLRKQQQKQAREREDAFRRWFYAPEVLFLQQWSGGLADAERTVIRLLAHTARQTHIYPHRWRCVHHMFAGTAASEEMADQVRRAMALLEVRGVLWPAGREHIHVDTDARTEDDLLYAFGQLLDWLPAITEHPAWAYDGLSADALRRTHPRDDAYRQRLIAEATEAAAYPQGRTLPPCPDCDA